MIYIHKTGLIMFISRKSSMIKNAGLQHEGQLIDLASNPIRISPKFARFFDSYLNSCEWIKL